MASAWGMVRGKPSNRKPLAQSGWAMRSLTRLMMRSSLTRPPDSITALACMPNGVPAFTAARSMSPVEIWGMPYFWQMNVAWVPLPAPGAPNRINLIAVLFSEFQMERPLVSGGCPSGPGPGGDRSRIACANRALAYSVGSLKDAENSPSAEDKERAHPRQIVGGVDALPGGLCTHMDRDAFAMPKHAQLLQRFGQFQGRGLQRRKVAQESRAVGVDADVAQRRGRGQGVPVRCIGHAITPPCNGRPAEVQRGLCAVEHHLDNVRVEEIGHLVDGVRRGAHHAIAAALEIQRHGGDQRRVHQ